MITAETLTMLTSLSAASLGAMLDESGYKGCVFTDAKFLGITNGGQYCYQVVYDDDEGSNFGKVFVTYDQYLFHMTADF